LSFARVREKAASGLYLLSTTTRRVRRINADPPCLIVFVWKLARRGGMESINFILYRHLNYILLQYDLRSDVCDICDIDDTASVIVKELRHTPFCVAFLYAEVVDGIR